MKWGVIAAIAVIALILLFRARNRTPLYGGVPVRPFNQNPQAARPPSATQQLGQTLGIPGAKYIDKADASVGAPIRSGTNAIDNFVNKNAVAPAKKAVATAAKATWKGIKKIF